MALFFGIRRYQIAVTLVLALVVCQVGNGFVFAYAAASGKAKQRQRAIIQQQYKPFKEVLKSIATEQELPAVAVSSHLLNIVPVCNRIVAPGAQSAAPAPVSFSSTLPRAPPTPLIPALS